MAVSSGASVGTAPDFDSAVVQTEDGVRIVVYAKPRSSRSKLLGIKNGALEVALAAAPVEGAANEALIETLAAAFAVPRKSVRLLSGQSGRNKRVEIDGLTSAGVAALLIRS